MTISAAAWESLCDGCGFCCMLPGTPFACPGLDVATNRCRVYDKRTETEVCVHVTPENVPTLHARGVLPDTCGYVRYVMLGVPAEQARLDFMRGAATMLPYEDAPEWLKAEYERQKANWFRGAADLQPRSA